MHAPQPIPSTLLIHGFLNLIRTLFYHKAVLPQNLHFYYQQKPNYFTSMPNF